MVTRETIVNGYKLTETRKRSHWLVFDVLGILMNLTSNNMVYFPRLFAVVYKHYVDFTRYSRTYSTLVIKKMDNYSGSYSELLAEALNKLEKEPPATIN